MKKLLALIFVALCTISIEAQTDDPITFADSKVKEICVANWDTNSDGELSTAEAAAVSDLGEVFESNPNINSFNELQYFTGLKSVGDGAFQHCTGLTSINIPNSVTSIGHSAFFYCNSLTDIVIPNSVVTIGRGAFEYTAWYDHQSEGVVYAGKVVCGYKGTMSSNTSIEFDEGTLSISDDVFYTLDNLISVTIPKSVVAIGRDAFACKNLSNIIVDADNKVFDSRDNCNAIIETATNKLIVGSVNTVIPNSVTSIGERAFIYRNLENIVIPESVTSIGDVAFYGCTFQNITIPKSVTSIEGSAFANCNKLQTMNVDGDNHVYDSRNNCNAIIETATNKLVSGCRKTIIPNSVSSIGRNAFANDTIDLIVIPESITFIDDLAFYRSMNHKDSKMIFKSSIPPTFGKEVFYSKGGTMYVPIGCKETYIMANEELKYFKIVEYENINFADAKVKELCVANWDTNGDGELSYAEAAAVTSLGKIFKGNTEIVSFDELQYFTGLTSINEYAFQDCSNLSSLKIPNSVTSLGLACFLGCWQLQTLTIPNSVTTLNDKIFYDCGIKSITIPQSVKSIGIPLFMNCPDLTTIIVEEGNPIYDSRDNCNAIIETSSKTLIASCKNTVIPQTVTTIGEAAFLYCSGLTSIVVPNNVLSIKGAAFRDCYDLTSVTLPNTITNIDTLTFWGCHVLESIIIPRSVKSIGDRAFGRCLQLKSVVIPSSTTTISSNAFSYCSELTSVTVGNSEPISISNFTNRTNATLYVPAGSKAAYEAASVWNEFKEIIEIENITFADSKVKEICVVNWDTNGDGEFSYAEAAAVTSLGEIFKGNTEINAFNELQYFTGVTSLSEAFNGCSNLVSVKLPESLERLRDSAFENCTSLSALHIPANVNFVGNDVIRAANALTALTVDENNEVYDSRNNCNAVIETATNTLIVACNTSVIPNGVETIGSKAFRYMTGLTSIAIPNSVTKICEKAFDGCVNLEALTIPNSVTTFESCVGSCDNLSSIIVEEGNKYYDSRNNCNAIIETATNTLISGCKNTIIPNGISKIRENAFYHCIDLTSITIPSSVTSIGAEAFAGCYSLVTVTVGNSTPVELTDGSTFSNRANATLYVPAGSKAAYEEASVWNEFKEIIEIENITFADSKVKEICVVNWDTNGDGELSYAEAAAVTSLDHVFSSNTEITSFNELQYFVGINEINREAFANCANLEYILLPKNVTTLSPRIFEQCDKLRELHIPASVTSINDAIIRGADGIEQLTVDENNPVFDSRDNCNAIINTQDNKLVIGCNVTVIPNTVITIGLKAFREMEKMETMPIPNSVTTIEEYAFADCNNLSSVTIPESVTNIGDRAFWGCDNLTSVTVLNKEPIAFPAGLRVFSNYDAVLKVPAGSKTSYKNAEVWKEFKDIVGELSITLNQYGKSTYCSEYALDFTNVEGLKAYVATGYNTRTGVVTMTRVMTTKGGTGLFLKGEQGSYKVPVIDESDDNTLNLLVGTLTKVTVNSKDDIYTNYKFTVKAGETEPGFYNFEDNSTLSANKAYLRIPTAWLPSTSDAKSVRMWFEDEEATGIDEINTNRPDSDTIYDMQGRRVKNPSKGIYIVNGKKMIMK